MKEKNKRFLLRRGRIIEALPSLHFRVKLDNGQEIIAHLAGRLRIHRIRVLPGDEVTVEFSPYDEKRGRIIYRGRYYKELKHKTKEVKK